MSQWFPLRGLTSENWAQLSWSGRIVDYLWHITLPVTAMVVSGFATLTMLTKNSFLDQIQQQYVVTARSKGLAERRVLYGHVFRNAMLLVIAGFPSAFIGVLFTGSVLIEVIFSLDGLGLLGFEAAIEPRLPRHVRDPVLLLAARADHEPDRRPDLHAGRSADRLRGTASLMPDVAIATPDATPARIRAARSDSSACRSRR